MNELGTLSIGGERIVEHVEQALKGGWGSQAESLLVCLGALAGYACQVYVRQAVSMPRSDAASFALMSVRAGDRQFLFGDALNKPLAESPYSVWALVGAALQKMGQPLPDLEDIFAHVSKTVGSAGFGVPRVESAHPPGRLPIDYLSTLWSQLMPIAQGYTEKPMQLPVVFGIALQRALEKTKDLIKPTLGARIAMECAVAMSKVVLPATSASPSGAPGNAAKPLHLRTGPRRPAQAVAPHSNNRMDSALMSLPPALRAFTIVLLVVISIAGALWQHERRNAREAERAAQLQRQEVFEEAVRRLQQVAREDAARNAATNTSKRVEPASSPAQPLPPPTPAGSDERPLIVLPDGTVGPAPQSFMDLERRSKRE